MGLGLFPHRVELIKQRVRFEAMVDRGVLDVKRAIISRELVGVGVIFEGDVVFEVGVAVGRGTGLGEGAVLEVS